MISMLSLRDEYAIKYLDPLVMPIVDDNKRLPYASMAVDSEHEI